MVEREEAARRTIPSSNGVRSAPFDLPRQRRLDRRDGSLRDAPAGAGVVEALEDRREQVVPAVVRPHAEQREHHHARRLGELQEGGERGVGGCVNALERFVDAGGGAMTGVRLVVEVPALVADAVRLGDHRQQHVPVGLLEDTARERRAQLETLCDGVDEGCELVRRPLDVIAVELDRRHEARAHEVFKPAWRRDHRRRVGAVRHPVRKRTASLESADGRLRHVEHRYSQALAVERLPERRVVHIVAPERPRPVIAGAYRLVMEAPVVPGTAAGSERGPGGVVAEPGWAGDGPGRAVGAQGRERRKPPRVRPARNQIELGAVEPDEQCARPPHRPTFADLAVVRQRRSRTLPRAPPELRLSDRAPRPSLAARAPATAGSG